MIDQLFPILNVADVGRSLQFWRDTLGGRIAFEWPGPDGAPVYVGVDLGAAHVGIGGPAPASPDGPRSIALWLYVDDCDGYVARVRSAGFRVAEEPTDQPWGERVARVLDPDGNEVILGQRASGRG